MLSPARWICAALLVAASQLPAHPGCGIVVAPDGAVFYTSGNVVKRLAPSGELSVVIEDPRAEKFYQLHHLFMDASLRLYTAADTGSGIWRLPPGGPLERFFPPPNDDRSFRVGLGGDPFCLDDSGNVIAVNSRQHRFAQVVRMDRDGRITLLVGGDWGHADGAGPLARFGDLHGSGFALGSDRRIYLTDDGRYVRSISNDGQVTTLAGGVSGCADGPGRDARFHEAAGVAVDRAGNIYVADAGNNRVRKVTPDGVTTTLASGLQEPAGVAVGPQGGVYVLEPSSDRVRRIAADGVITTITPRR